MSSSAVPKIITGRQLLDSLFNAGEDHVAEAGTVEGTLMPKIIHQSWKSRHVPGVYNTMRNTWLNDYPDWTHVLWIDQDNADLVKELYPQNLELYQGFEAEIFRADIARNMYMHTFGGIYVDLDFDSYKSLELLIQEQLQEQKQGVILGRMAPPMPHNDFCEQSSIPNAFLSSTPGHPFWLNVLQNIQEAWDLNEITSNGKPARERPDCMTGPVVLYRTYKCWLAQEIEQDSAQDKQSVIVLEPKYMYPLAWYATEAAGEQDKHETLDHAGKEFNLEEARAKFNDGIAYACTYWGASWKKNGWKPDRARRS